MELVNCWSVGIDIEVYNFLNINFKIIKKFIIFDDGCVRVFLDLIDINLVELFLLVNLFMYCLVLCCE